MKAEEIKEKKRRLERDLKTLITDFEEATGTHVESLRLEHAYHNLSDSTSTVLVKAEVQI